MTKPKKVIRSKYMYKKRSHKGRNTVLFILLIALLVGLGYVLSKEWSKRFGPGTEQSSLPESSGESSLPASSETSSEPVTPTAVKAKLLPQSDMMKTAGELSSLFQSYKDEGYTGIYIELKTADGVVTFDTTNELARQYGTIAENPASLDSILTAAKEAGLVPVARISALKDPLAPHVSRSNSYAYENNTQYNWLDNAADLGGKPWLNPYMENARKYISDFCGEAASRGFELIVLENVNFPTTPYSSKMGTINETATRAGILDQLLSECQAAAGEIQVVAGADPAETLLYDTAGRGLDIILAEREYPGLAPLLNLDSFRNNALLLKDKLGLSDSTAEGDALALSELEAAVSEFKAQSGAGGLVIVREADWALVQGYVNMENLLYTIFI